MMRFASLGSGSQGNATLIECGATRVLVDCGFMLRDCENRLRRLGIAPDTLSAILVTHEHHDHIGGVSRVARKYSVPVWMTAGTRAGWLDPDVPQLRLCSPHEDFVVGELTVRPFPVPHDAREPCHFVFSDGRHRVGVLSDAGAVTPHMRACLSGLDALMLEFNHDLQMLAAGPYPPVLKARVGGNLGHLSNRQSAQLLRDIDISRLQHLVLTHISQKNNTPELAYAAASEALGSAPPWLACARQDEGFAWREVA
ncbi:MAG TPA: MBL fold metallo-hydrolase [Nevskiaceae bacterium]|nr:MBL fold metallo-hydrolase [Nevskiaceae bacterium]